MKTLLILIVCAALSGCTGFIRYLDEQNAAERAEFQRDWDAMTPEQRMQYRLTQQQLAVQAAQQGRPVTCTSTASGGAAISPRFAPPSTTTTVCQ